MSTFEQQHPNSNAASNGPQVDQPAQFVTRWVEEKSKVAPNWKRAISRYAATHLVKYGNVVHIGSGSSLNILMDELIEWQRNHSALDLIVFTNNLHVLDRGLEAERGAPEKFRASRIIIAGGSVQPSLHSLVGQFTAQGVMSDSLYPHLVFFGVAGLRFERGELLISYQFEDELSTQVAHATRSADHRVLLCDHTKIGWRSAWKADISTESLLAQTRKCTIISTLPEPADTSSEMSQEIDTQIQEFNKLLERLERDPHYAEKDLIWLFVNADGEVKRELSLSLRRKAKLGSNGSVGGASISVATARSGQPDNVLQKQ